MALPPLKVVIGADTTQLENALGVARKGLKTFAVAGVAAIAGVTTALTAMTSAGLASVDAQQKLARSIDGTVNGLRAVQLAGGYAGVSVGEVNTALQQMNRELVRAKEEGSPAAQAIEKLGFRAEQLEGLDADRRLALIADRAKQMGLSAGEASDILRDLGIRSRNMALLVTGGGDAIRAARDEVRAFGLELSETETGAIESANDAVSRMGLIFEGLRNQLAVNVAPVLQSVADSFSAFAQSDAAQTAVEGLAGAFGDLIAVAGSEDFLTAAIGAFEGLVNISTALADGLVWVTQNMELFTLAASGAATALVVLGGPISAIVTAAGLAAAGLLTLSNRSDDLEEAAYAAEKAEIALKDAISDFDVVTSSANGTARDRAVALKDQAEIAVAAAEAELLLGEAELKRFTQRGGAGGAMAGAMDPNAREGAIAGVNESIERVAELRQQLENVQRTVNALRMSEPRGGATNLPPVTFENEDEDDDTGGIIPGLGSAGDIANEFEQRLETLMQGLATEKEVLDEWYEQGIADLQSARERKLMTEKEYLEARERLEREYAERSAQIESMRQENNLQTVTDGMGQILSAAGQGNKKLLKASQVFNAGMAWIDTLAGAARELRKGTFGFASAAAVIAKGIGFVNAINSVSSGGGTSGTAATGAGAGGGGGAPASLPVQQMIIETQGGGMIPQSSMGNIIDQINELGRQGHLIDIRFVGSA